VRFHVLFSCVFGVLVCVKTMPMRKFCMMRSLLMVTGFVMFCSFMVVPGSVLMMFSCLFMVVACFFRHFGDPFHRVVA
jgi:hypothetical protein